MPSNHFVKILLDLVTKMVVQVAQPYVAREAGLPVSLSGYVPGRIVLSLENSIK